MARHGQDLHRNRSPVPRPPLSTDATLSGLTLSGMRPLAPSTPAITGYDRQRRQRRVTETTVTPTLSDDGATYAIKLERCGRRRTG